MRSCSGAIQFVIPRTFEMHDGVSHEKRGRGSGVSLISKKKTETHTDVGLGKDVICDGKFDSGQMVVSHANSSRIQFLIPVRGKKYTRQSKSFHYDIQR